MTDRRLHSTLSREPRRTRLAGLVVTALLVLAGSVLAGAPAANAYIYHGCKHE